MKQEKHIYDHAAIEKKWQQYWQSKQTYATDAQKGNKFYILDMFPYPSGEGLHVGHPKGYIATDVVSRMKRMQGFSVLHPMGFDAFGLPAENYAIKTETNPATSVAQNVQRYKKQLEIIGLDYDWSREINTTDPEFYRWTQWIFLQLLKKGLAFESYEPINWCPFDKTGLANEDIVDGHCERCGTLVEKRPMRQWVLRITDYAERLLADLDAKDTSGTPLLDWPQSIKELQRNWIGKSEGVELPIEIVGDKSGAKETAHVFTTRIDTLYGLTYIVLAPEHPLVANLLVNANNRAEIETYIAATKQQSTVDRTDAKRPKTGVTISGVHALHPITKERVPVFIADYVLADYGTGAVMGVPAHDERDYDFAQKYSLAIKQVVIPVITDPTNPHRPDKRTATRRTVHAIIENEKDGTFLTLKWKQFNWRTVVQGGVDDGEDVVQAALREVKEETGYTDLEVVQVLGGPIHTEHFADHKDENRIAITTGIHFRLLSDKRVPVADEEIAKHEVEWIKKSDYTPERMTNSETRFWIERMKTTRHPYTGDGVLFESAEFTDRKNTEIIREIAQEAGGSLVTRYKLRDWVFSRQRYWGEPIPVIHCEKCGAVPVPEADLPVTLPKVESYEPTGTGESPLAAIESWVNVPCPTCGGKAKRETNTMPQWAGSSWYYLRYIDPHNKTALVDRELERIWQPVDLYVGGAEHATRHLIYARFWHKFLFDIGAVTTSEPFKKLQHVGLIIAEDGRKMSKRYGNVVNPDDVIATYGADTLRVYEMFMGPFDQEISWSTANMIGSRRFVERVFKLHERVSGETSASLPEHAEALLHKTIKKVTEDIAAMRFNTAISALMILLNEFESHAVLPAAAYATLVKMVAPFAPHVADELWSVLGEEGSIHLASWPVFDPAKITESTMSMAIQVNGKVRGELTVRVDESDADIRTRALEDAKITPWILGKTVDKVIIVKGKLISIVVK